ncbi:MAG TPA: hypothetical protein VF275_04490 [Gammaproteobacteria bacterium]
MRILCIIATLFIATACTGEPAERYTDIVRSPGKPLHPIQVHAEVDGPLRAGVETGARLVVTSSRPVESVEVVLQPELATVISRNRFERRVSDSSASFARRSAQNDTRPEHPMDFNFRVRPASDAPQPVRVLVRVTGPDGRVLTREVTVSLSSEKSKSNVNEKQHRVVIENVPEPANDVVVPAQQEVTRGD